MSEKKTASVVIDGKTYTEDQLNDQQKMMVNQAYDEFVGLARAA